MQRLGRAGWAILLLAGLAFCLVSQYGDALHQPFVNDDYVILEKVEHARLGAVLSPHPALFGWYRPISRELYYWAMERMVGLRAAPYHVVNFGLWLTILFLFALLVRSLSDFATASVATAGAALSALWAAPLYWVAGGQDLWMLAFGLAFLLAARAGRLPLAMPCLLLALLSKESAVLLLPVGVAINWVARRDRRETLTLLGIGAPLCIAWALLHPSLMDRLYHPIPDAVELRNRPPALLLFPRALLSLVALDSWPRPEHGWFLLLGSIAFGWIGAVLLLVAGRRGSATDAPAPAGPRGYAAIAALWTLSGIAPAFTRSLGFHNYYLILGLFGFWMLVARPLARSRRWIFAVFGLLAILRAGAEATPSWDWGTAWYQARAGRFLDAIHRRVLELEPSVPTHSRLYFARIPNNIGFIAGTGPSIRIWYGDSTLSAFLISNYAPRRALEPAGRDYFFRFDTSRVMVELRLGPEDARQAMIENPDWLNDHFKLATLFLQKGDYSAAGDEFGKVSAVVPERPECALYAAICLESARRMADARPLYARARRGYPTDAAFERMCARLKATFPGAGRGFQGPG